MPKLAIISAKFAETPLEVRAKFLLFATTRIFLQGMSVDALVLYMTMAILLEELADRNPVFLISVQVLTCVALPARLFEPVHTYLLLDLVLVCLVLERFDDFF